MKDLKDDLSYEINSEYRTVFINAGKKQKLRKADILGTLIKSLALQKDDIGRIDSLDFCSYVAIKKEKIKKVLELLPNTKIKGKYFKIYEK